MRSRHNFLLGIAIVALSFSAWAGPETGVLAPPRNGSIYVVAHRGAHDGIPENSLPAYEKAIELGCDYVEIDVRTTKDGRLVSIHNATVDAYVEGVTGRVDEMTFDELRALDIGARIDARWKGTVIPSLEEILDLCRERIGIYLDLKDAEVAPIISMLRERGMERDVLWYAGDAKLDEVRERCPECIVMPDPGPAARLETVIERHQPDVVASVHRHCTAEFVRTCHDQNALVIVDDAGPDTWNDLLDWGVDGIQTDEPEALIALLRERRVAAVFAR